jgi:hypothetical protein
LFVHQGHQEEEEEEEEEERSSDIHPAASGMGQYKNVAADLTVRAQHSELVVLYKYCVHVNAI